VPAAVPNPIEYGIVTFALLIVWKLLDVAKTLFLAKKVEPAAVAGQFPCVVDPEYSPRIKAIYEMTKATESDKAAGRFECHWKDRDEVRDFMEAIRAQTAASKLQTHAVNELTKEMRLTRNGKSGQ
jgi:hypothetical protein